MAAFDKIGPYQRGVWLIEKPGDTPSNSIAALVTRANLPREGTGWSYYWLGGTPQQAASRVDDAISKMPIDSAGVSPVGQPQITYALQGRPYRLRVGEAGGGGVDPATLFLYGLGGVGAAKVLGRTRPGGAAAGAGAGAAAGAGGIGAGRLAAGAGIAGAGLAFGGASDFFKMVAWLFHPLNWLRAVEFVTGLLIIYMGMRLTIRGRHRRLRGYTPFGRTLRTVRRVSQSGSTE